MTPLQLALEATTHLREDVSNIVYLPPAEHDRALQDVELALGELAKLITSAIDQAA